MTGIDNAFRVAHKCIRNIGSAYTAQRRVTGA